MWVTGRGGFEGGGRWCGGMGGECRVERLSPLVSLFLLIPLFSFFGGAGPDCLLGVAPLEMFFSPWFFGMATRGERCEELGKFTRYCCCSCFRWLSVQNYPSFLSLYLYSRTVSFEGFWEGAFGISHAEFRDCVLGVELGMALAWYGMSMLGGMIEVVVDIVKLSWAYIGIFSFLFVLGGVLGLEVRGLGSWLLAGVPVRSDC